MAKKKYPILLLFTIAFFLDAQSALALKCDATEPRFTRRGLVENLRRGNFSNLLNEYVDLQRLGNIKVSEKTCYTLYVYTVEYNSGPGTDVHGMARLVVIKNWDYVGMYPIDEKLPSQIYKNTVEFPGGFKIILDRENPPNEAYLYGETVELFK